MQNQLKYMLLGVLFAAAGCNSPTETQLQNLVGTTGLTTPSELGNQAFTFSPSAYNFGNKALGTAPSSRVVEITNSSSHVVYLSSISGVAGAFAITADDCPRSPSPMIPNSSCTATVSFLPTAGMTYTTSLTMNYGISAAQNNTFTATMNLLGTGVGTLTFAGIDSVSEIYNTQLKLNWTHAAGALTYYVFRVNADTSVTLVANVAPPTASYIVSGLAANTTYKYWVRATDALGAFDSNMNVVTTSTNGTPPAPVLTGFQNYVYPMSATAVGATLAFNVDDNRSGTPSDSNVTYSCAYDQSVNNSVGATSCTTLQGTVSFNTSTGAFSWTPTAQSTIGFYEFKMTVTDNTSGLSDTEYFIVNVKPNLYTTNLLACYSGNFANQSYNQTSGTTWKDNMALYDGTLNNFSFGGATGWKGAGTIADHYRLTFDGTDDYVDLGTVGNTSTSLSFDGWINTAQLNSNPKGTIISSADSSGKGLMVREAKGYKGRLEVIKGGKSYADEVLADNPVSYLRMGDVSGEATYDIGSASPSWTVTSVSGFERPGVLGGNDKALGFNGTSSRIKSTNVSPAAWPGVTYEIWFSMSASQYASFFSHAVQNYVTGYYWAYYQPGWFTFQYANGTTSVSTAYAFTPTLNTWYHLVWTFDVASHNVKMYLNGTLVKDSTPADVPVIATVVNPTIAIGAYNTGTEGFFAGSLDEAAVYSSALTQARIVAHYNAKANNVTCLSNRMDDSKWNHFAGVYDHAVNILKLFNNSYLDCSLTTGTAAIDLSTARTSMGATLPSAGAPNAGTYFNGSIKDLRVYNAAITNAQVDANMAAQIEQFDFPNSVAGLNLWLKADAITGLNDNDPIPQWNDSSGLGRNATQATASKRPIYIANGVNGKPTVRFDGTDDEMVISGTNTSWTLFIVAKQNATRASVMHFMSGLSPFWQYISAISANTTHLTWYDTNWASYQTLLSNAGTTNYHIQTYRGNGALAQGWVDGVLALNNSGTFTAGYLSKLGNFATADTRWLNGEIAEALAYSGTLTDNERRRIEGYLKAKYGL